MKTLVSIRNDRMYLTGHVKVVKPTSDEVSSFNGVDLVKAMAPNENILWLSGEYVAGGTPNRNGQQWDSEEISIKSLQPVLMPVTIMHDFGTAVGVIADTRLCQAEISAGVEVQPAKLHTVLAIWAHRFPEIAREILINNEQGSLMQSQECDAPAYECSECGLFFIKPVDETSHCDHLKNGSGSRTLHDVTFTGTGLIFGTRGAKGANPNANLDILAEVAQWSDRRIRPETSQRSKVDEITIKRSEYDELKARPSADDLAKAQSDTQAAKDATAEAEKQAEQSAIEAKGAEEKLTATQTELDEMKETSRKAELASERLEKVPAELSKKLPESVNKRLAEQAKSLSDDDWNERLTELSEMAKVTLDDNQSPEFSNEELSSFNANGGVGGTEDFSLGDIGAGLAKLK